MHSVMLPSLLALFMRLSRLCWSSLIVMVTKPLGAIAINYVDEYVEHKLHRSPNKYRFTVRALSVRAEAGHNPAPTG